MSADGAHVLVVDDEPAVREALRRALELEGYRVALAEDGADALAQIAADAPDAVVLDVLMPVVDGLTACRRLRQQGSRVPVLMLTARDSVGDRVAGLDAGADDYLVKPFALEELLARIRALLRRGDGTGRDGVLAFADLTLARCVRRLPAAQDGGRGRAAPDPDRAWRRLRAARAVTLSRRLALAS